MDASLGGLVVHWGGGEDKWFKAYSHGSLQSSTDTKHKINKSAEGEHNLVLVKSKVKDSEGIIDVNVSGISPKTGKQRHIGYVFNISNSSLKPTLGLQGTQYEFLSSEKK